MGMKLIPEASSKSFMVQADKKYFEFCPLFLSNWRTLHWLLGIPRKFSRFEI